jgi:hypothetical protein
MGKQFNARRLFGLAAVLFGVIALLWHDRATWQNLYHLWRLPSGVLIGTCLMVAQIAGGFGIQFRKTARLAASILCVVYLCFSLACIPDIVAAANSYDKFGGSFFLFLSLLCAAVALAQPGGASLAGRLARLGLGVCALSFALSQALLLRDTAAAVPGWLPPSQRFWAFFTTVAFALAAISILANLKARLATRMMALMVGLFALLVWVPLLLAHPKSHFDWSECALTLLVAGAVWTLADAKSS